LSQRASDGVLIGERAARPGDHTRGVKIAARSRNSAEDIVGTVVAPADGMVGRGVDVVKRIVRRSRIGWIAVGGALLAGCSANSADIHNQIDGTIICDGQTLKELTQAKTISDECKAELTAYLPKPENSFSSRIVVLGSRLDPMTGALSIFAQGADAQGAAIDRQAWASATVSVGGTALASGSFTVTALADLPGDWMSLGVVNDYSGSMSTADLGTVAQIETDLFTYVPRIYEGEVTLFSTEVTLKQAFTQDQALLLDAVKYDAAFTRDLTALYDGMGTGLDSLVQRSRPIRILFVSTDGLENSSTHYTKPPIVQKIADQQIAVVMLGALFADVAELKSLMGSRGVFFYTPLYKDLRASVEQFLRSAAEMVEVRIPPEQAQARPIHIEVGGVSVDFSD
jgi:hypothetical protein